MVYIKYLCEVCYNPIDLSKFNINKKNIYCDSCNNYYNIKNNIKLNCYNNDTTLFYDYYKLNNCSIVKKCRNKNCAHVASYYCYNYCIYCAYLEHDIIIEKMLENIYYSLLINFKKYINLNYKHYLNNMKSGVYYLCNNYNNINETISLYRASYEFTFSKKKFYIVFQNDINIVKSQHNYVLVKINKKYCYYIICFDNYKYKFDKIINLINFYLKKNYNKNIRNIKTLVNLL